MLIYKATLLKLLLYVTDVLVFQYLSTQSKYVCKKKTNKKTMVTLRIYFLIFYSFKSIPLKHTTVVFTYFNSTENLIWSQFSTQMV